MMLPRKCLQLSDMSRMNCVGLRRDATQGDMLTLLDWMEIESDEESDTTKNIVELMD